MKVIKAYPPNYTTIAAAFPQARKPGVIFAYGDSIFNPSSIDLTPALIAHESVHARQHRQFDGGPAAWWDRYIADPQFRFEQELEAHREEYAVACNGLTRNQRRQVLRGIAHRLSSKLYGGLVTADEAKRLISKGEEIAA